MSLKINTCQRKDIQLYPKYFDVMPWIYHYSDEYEEWKTPYISASNENNWVQQFINLEPDFEWNCIITWKVWCTAFYQSKSFCATSDVNIFKPKFNLTKEIWLFITTIINFNENYRWWYWRQCRVWNSKKIKIRLPINNNWEPDREFMENYIKSLHYKPITTRNKKLNFSLDTNKRKEFPLDKLFMLKWWFYNKKPEHSIDWKFPFLASTESNNWVTEYYSLDDIETWDKVWNQDNTLDKKIYEWNCIAVTVNGSVCNAFYQNREFTCSHDITALYLKWHTLNQYIALFLCSVIMKEKYRWSYWRKPHDVKKFWKSIIKLPVDNSWNPDREFMENYIKNLPYWDRI